MLLTCKNGHGPMEPKFSMSGNHIKATCFICNCYIKFVAHKDLGAEDLENLEEQIKNECDFDHEDKHILRDQMDEHLGDFNYCPGCGRRLKNGK